MLRSVTTGIKNFLSHVKNHLSSLVHTCSNMTLNCKKHRSTYISLNCQDPSSCMTLNYPLHSSTILEHSSHAHRPCDCLRTDDTTYNASFGTSDLDSLSSTDSTQTHDSLVTPESPQYLPSPRDSLEEGITQARANDQVI